MEPHTSQRKLRRLAPRSIRVHERQRDRSPALRAYDGSLPLRAQTFMDRHDAVQQHDTSRSQMLERGRAAIAALLGKVREWSPTVVRDIPSLSLGDFGERPEVADDVIRDAERLRDAVADHVTDAGEPLPYRDLMVEDMHAALSSTVAQWKQAEAAVESIAALRDAARKAAVAFERELVAYRKVLAAVIGRTHPDYHKLRVTQAPARDDDDDANAPVIGIESSVRTATQPT